MGTGVGTGVRGTNVLTADAARDTIAGVTFEKRFKHRCKVHELPVLTVDLEHRVLIITSQHRGSACENVIPLVELGLEPITLKQGKKKDAPESAAKKGKSENAGVFVSLLQNDNSVIEGESNNGLGEGGDETEPLSN